VDLQPWAEYAARFPRQRLAAGVLLHSADGRVALVEQTYKRDWDIPGGVVEIDEAPWSAAAREVLEELGTDVAVGRPLVIDHLTARATADSLAPTMLEEATKTSAVLTGGLYWIFDGGRVTDDDVDRLTIDGTEVRAIRLCSPEDVRRRARPSLARRVLVALDAVRTGVGPTLCDNGVPV
jgi:8-oxo-dGTP pyrophosphatase MutT (NUDIX family)